MKCFIMAISSAVEKDGTLTLPKSIREKAHLERGGRIAIDMDGPAEEVDVPTSTDSSTSTLPVAISSAL